MKFYAHTDPNHTSPEEAEKHWEPLFTKGCGTLKGEPCEQCERLDSQHGHLNKVAYLAGKFAEEMFSSGSEEAKVAKEWGRLAGLWHDLGKFAPEFQNYIRATNGDEAHIEGVPSRVDHSTAGALWGNSKLPPAMARVVAYAIAGHHSGLANIRYSDMPNANRPLTDRMEKPPVESLHSHEVASAYLDGEARLLALPFKVNRDDLERFAFDLALFTRLLFSCLVDADRLCTEAFCDHERSKRRRANQPSFETMQSTLHEYIENLKANAKPSKVNDIRNRVYGDCIDAAKLRPGLFSLSVPTGGGKTLSSLAFALRHALEHPQAALRRIVYVIPFTSIIEQNAAEYRKVFEQIGADVVLEHHCNLDTDAWEKNPLARLRTENWDAPLIVTTAVQFYESLFSAKTRRCRKLHNLAGSVIILDEAQSIPVHFLQPCLWALDSLAKHFGCTVVFCTATQPSIKKTDAFPIGFSGEEENGVREIVRDSAQLFRDLKRVEVEHLGALSDEELANRLNEETQTLCIVNTRKHAAGIFEMLNEDCDSNFHLSTRMCPVHRRYVLGVIRNRLKEGLPCCLISTSLIEAGVDVDFPSVYRCVAGMDSIAQAAGRCNREGKRQRGSVYVFETDSELAKVHPDLAKPIDSTRLTFPHYEDPLSEEAIEAYFTQHYSKFQSSEGRWDAKSILEERNQSYTSQGLAVQFRDIESAFRLIPEEQTPIFVPYGEEGKALCSHWMESREFPNAREMRVLQHFSVQLRDAEVAALVGDIFLHPIIDSFRFLVNPDLYDRKRGLLLSNSGQWNAETLTV